MSAPQQEMKIGFDAAWHVSFWAGDIEGAPLVSIGRADYYADIKVTLADGLVGGSYALTIEGMTDEHYRSLAKAKGLVGKLFFYWRGRGAPAYFADLVGLGDVLDSFPKEPRQDALVGIFAVQQLARRAGTHRIVVSVEGRDLGYDRLASKRVLSPIQASTTIDLVESIAKKFYHPTRVHTHPSKAAQPSGAGSKTAEKPTPEPNLGRTAAEVLSELGQALEQQSRRFGRGMFLLRDAELHVGPERPIPHDGRIKKLDLDSGLVEVLVTGEFVSDPNWDYVEHQGKDPPARATYALTCLGRADLKPGDAVSFVPPPEHQGQAGATTAALTSAAAVAGVETGSSATMYVASVAHSYSRTTGFITQLSGIDITHGSPWDEHSETGQPGDTNCKPSAVQPTPTGKAAVAVQKLVGNTTAGRRLLEIGEIRGATVKTTKQDFGQTVAAFRGLVASDGEPRRAHRQDIERNRPGILAAVPYASPFAWGKCGLVLPRYPGTRVLLEHRNGFADDPIDIGALWDAGDAPDSQPGDWWLILPTEIVQRQAIAQDVTPDPPSGKGTNDLVDADGNRVIEVGELTIRVGRDSLRPIGERPKRAKDAGGDIDCITIEHADAKAKIVIESDGTIVIHAAKDLVLRAPNGDVKVDAKNVQVKVTGKMDVS